MLITNLGENETKTKYNNTQISFGQEKLATQTSQAGMTSINSKQAKEFAVKIKDLIPLFIEENKAEYLKYLESIKNKDLEALNELNSLKNK